MGTLRMFTVVFFVTLGLAGCNDAVPTKTPDKVTVQLKYKHQAQFAGIYVALDKGYYKEENLEVQLKEGGSGIDLIAPVVEGDAQFGIASSDLILAKRAEGMKIKAIAAIYRRSAAIFVSKAGSGIKRPHDMVGKRIAVFSKNAKEYEFQLRAMLNKLNLDISEMELLPLDHNYEGFLGGDVDVTGAYLTGGVLRLKSQGAELNYIFPSDYGIDFYSDTIFVNESLLEHDSDLALRFLRATLKGWNDAIKDMKNAVDISVRYSQKGDKHLETVMMDTQLPLIYTGDDHIGWMSEKVWSGMNRILFEQEVIEKPLDDINSVYTMELLRTIYTAE